MSAQPGLDPRDASGYRADSAATTHGVGWVLFAGIMILMVGFLNVIYGIAAIDESSFFVQDTKFILSGLQTWGWVTLILGVIQVIAAYSIWNGGTFGKWAGITLSVISAIVALLSIPAYPFWSLAIFAVDVLIIYGLAAYGGRGTTDDIAV